MTVARMALPLAVPLDVTTQPVIEAP
jgi:hypothetical protein